jgi:hypothetical protein
MLRARLGTALLLVALAGCGDDGGAGSTVPDHPCTEIGCGPPSAIVELSGMRAEPVAVTICAEQRCATVRSRGDQLTAVNVGLPEDAGESVRVVVEVRSGRRVLTKQAAVVPVKSSRPNGPDCPPVCKLARARLDVGAGVLKGA